MAINIDLSNVNIEVNKYIKDKSIESLEKVLNKSGKGNNYLGWVDLPIEYDIKEYEKVKKCSEKIKKIADVLVVIGIGGSYLGVRAVENSLKPYFNYNKDTEIIYAGHNLSSTYMVELIEYLEDKDYCINVISKSGATLETAVAFRILKENIEKKYGKENSKERIFVTTDKKEGLLKNIAEKEDYETFVIPSDIGGRFSVFTSVGILPLAVVDVDIDKLLLGAKKGREKYSIIDFNNNMALNYAAIRKNLYDDGKVIENFIIYEEKLKYISEWWKQLYAESEGKDGKGIFPVSSIFTTDLHSKGQIIQDGIKNIFETVISIKTPMKDIYIGENIDNLDNLNYLENRSLDYINQKAMLGTVIAHSEGNVSNIVIELDKLDEENIGELLYFFEMSVAISAYMLDVNPFNQLGVDKYKAKVLKLLKGDEY